MIESTSEEFSYCVLSPEHIENNDFIEGKAYGVGSKSDSTDAYDTIFKLNNDIYKILAMCIYEVKYVFGLD
jgi:hypothetical protein